MSRASNLLLALLMITACWLADALLRSRIAWYINFMALIRPFSLVCRLSCGVFVLSLLAAFLTGLPGVAYPLPARAARLAESSAGKIIYVDKRKTGGLNNGQSWADAYLILQSAIDAAVPGDQIWIAEGIYLPTRRTATDMRSKTFLLSSGVAMYGSFLGNETNLSQRAWRSHPTVLSGDLAGDDVGFTNNTENSFHVLISEAVTETARLDGFIIQGGNANGSPPDSYGGGWYNKSGNPSLVNLIFYQNYALSGGGLFNDYADSLIVNCAWIGNRAEFGGGVDNFHSSPIFVTPLFSGNYAEIRAGAIFSSYSNPTVTNGTVGFNFAADTVVYPGALLNNNGSLLILNNSILWGNGDYQISNVDSSTSELYYSLIQDTPSQTSCNVPSITCYGVKLNVDPQFVDPPGFDTIIGTLDDNERLKITSPAINAGSNSLTPLDELDINYNGDYTEKLPYDLDNTWRFAQAVSGYIGSGTPPIVDMGAYETKAVVYLPTIRK